MSWNNMADCLLQKAHFTGVILVWKFMIFLSFLIISSSKKLEFSGWHSAVRCPEITDLLSHCNISVRLSTFCSYWLLLSLRSWLNLSWKWWVLLKGSWVLLWIADPAKPRPYIAILLTVVFSLPVSLPNFIFIHSLYFCSWYPILFLLNRKNGPTGEYKFINWLSVSNQCSSEFWHKYH